MGFKHFFGFCLLIVGLAMAPVFVAFLSDRQFFNPVFLFTLGFGAVASFLLGLYILNKSN